MLTRSQCGLGARFNKSKIRFIRINNVSLERLMLSPGYKYREYEENIRARLWVKKMTHEHSYTILHTAPTRMKTPLFTCHADAGVHSGLRRCCKPMCGSMFGCFCTACCEVRKMKCDTLIRMDANLILTPDVSRF
jgi:hypothetical protein